VSIASQGLASSSISRVLPGFKTNKIAKHRMKTKSLESIGGFVLLAALSAGGEYFSAEQMETARGAGVLNPPDPVTVDAWISGVNPNEGEDVAIVYDGAAFLFGKIEGRNDPAAFEAVAGFDRIEDQFGGGVIDKPTGEIEPLTMAHLDAALRPEREAKLRRALSA
jgi:hypothetical protein